MAKHIQKDDNFLELIPQKNPDQQWETTPEGTAQLIIPRDGLMERIVRRVFKTPEVMRIDLDAYGTCVWTAIDGERTIADIGNALTAQFGEDIEPLYERLGTYMNILRNNKFIQLEKRVQG